MPASDFASVKLPVSLVDAAREAAAPMRRSVAGQIEYWATLGKITEHSGLSVQEARGAIEAYETAARRAAQRTAALDDIEGRFMAAETSGTLADRVRAVIDANQSPSPKRRPMRKSA